MLPEPLPVYASLPFGETATQQGAPKPTGSDAVIAESAPPAPERYEETVPAPASETITSPRWPNANPNGTAPLDGVTTGAPGRPAASSASVSSRLERRSVTTRRFPSGAAETCAAPTAPGRSRVPPAIGASESPDARNAVTFGVPPELSTHTRPLRSSTLAGATPPEATTSSSARPPLVTRSTDTVFEPALTA